MKILISGASGVVGSAVASHLAREGFEIARLVRRAPGAGEVFWDPDGGTIDAQGLEGFDGVVHVATRSWSGRWTPAFKQAIRDNHVGTIKLIADTLARVNRKPGMLVCASGMGIYPSSGDQVITENSPTGSDFLANLQCEGEASAIQAVTAGIRVVHMRIPMVLGGPALANLAANARSGFGRLGSGRQWCSWVSRDELANIVHFVLGTEAVTGPINVSSPQPVRNIDLVDTLARILDCKPRFPIPAFMLRLMAGEMADALALASRRMVPQRLLAAGYTFRFPELEAALRHELAELQKGGK